MIDEKPESYKRQEKSSMLSIENPTEVYIYV